MRFRLTLAHLGAPFAGWQRQPNAPTVQATLEEALAKLAGIPVATVAASRTDAGVHARGQVVHLDLDRPLPAAA
ncbi:MAG TPA: tRNA pseudouridine(38-40) synthase TruA, partial [Thermoanaerobaculia bacterium]|nr:tRNA pseudouridine(38-40) synthase TruA [Thermoanaerobaculia bacterium]